MSKKNNHIKGWITAFVIALLLIFSSRIFFMQSEIVHDTNMSNSVIPGDYVFINKLIYGARIPTTPLSIPFTGKYSTFIKLPYHRFSGIGHIANNDIIAFNYPHDTLFPMDKRKILIKRVIAIPGNTISMMRKKVFVNNKEIVISETQYAYIIKCTNKDEFKKLIIQNQLTEGGRINKNGFYKLFLTKKQLDDIVKNTTIKFIKPNYITTQSDFMFNSTYNPRKWNSDYFDSLVVPKKGSTIKLSINNAGAYESLIRNFEGNQFKIQDSIIMINNKPTTQYTFKKNYYFVLDDNRDNANDSRNWGFLPEEYILGKATRILFSYNYNNRWWQFFRLNRTFRKL